jgi:ferredoxin
VSRIRPARTWRTGFNGGVEVSRRTAKVIVVDAIACDGHGVCAELLPEWIRLDDWGYPIIREGAVPPHLLAQARWAVSNCPALALSLRSEFVPAARAVSVDGDVAGAAAGAPRSVATSSRGPARR